MKFTLNKEAKVRVILAEKDLSLDFLSKELQDYAKEVEFAGKKCESLVNLGPGTDNTILFGLGSLEDAHMNIYRESAYKLGKLLNSHKIKETSLEIHTKTEIDEVKVFSQLMEGLLNQEYEFDYYMSEKKKRYIEKISLISEKLTEETIEEVQNLLEAINFARDLVNLTPIDLYPKTLAKMAKEKLSPLGIKMEILGKEEIKELGMKAFLAVAEGSEKEPKFIIMKYLPLGDIKEHITLVGKGLTYDSGGYGIKTTKGMVDMKTDMAGSASVIGAIYALAKNKVQKNVVALVAACENMISGGAYKNGDIISSMKGSTIEIKSTDAEGRLTLADAIYYGATKLKSSAIIDVATLTGACIAGLGDFTIGAVTNSDPLFDKIKKSADESGEYVHKLPVIPELRDQVKGQFSDLVNSTYKPGGAITAGIFLEHFTENTPWVHLDIAGPSFSSSQWSYHPLGATGQPVKTLYNFVKEN